MRPWSRRISVILIPEGGAHTYSFQVRTLLLIIGLAIALVLLIMSVTLVFSQGRLLLTLRENARLKRHVRMLDVELEKVRTLEQQLRESEATRRRVLTLLGAAGYGLDSLQTAEGAIVQTADSDELRLRADDFFRAVPSSWPVRGPITRGFASPGATGNEYHPGIDLAAASGTPVRAAASGTVIFAGNDPVYGNLVIVDHGMGYETRYGHNSRLNVRTGERLKRGQLIAAVGNTGRSTAPHLHFEVRKDGVPVDPRPFLD